jgi:uncharacterized membrane protein (UPF0127 family)
MIMEQGYIHIHNNVLPTLLAVSHEEQARGLMYQEWPPPVMSFIYAEPQVNKFWMANTKTPLDIIFCHQGKVSQIHVGEPFSTSMIGDDKFSDLIVELPYGTADKLGLKIGHLAGLVSPTPDELRKIIAKKYHLFTKF